MYISIQYIHEETMCMALSTYFEIPQAEKISLVLEFGAYDVNTTAHGHMGHLGNLGVFFWQIADYKPHHSMPQNNVRYSIIWVLGMYTYVCMDFVIRNSNIAGTGPFQSQ